MSTKLALFRLLFKSQLEHMVEWDEGLRRYHTKNMLIAELTEFLLSIDTDATLKARRDDLLRRAAVELDPDAIWTEGELRLLADGETRMGGGEGLPRRIVVEDSAANLRSLLESAIRYERDNDPVTQEAKRKAQAAAQQRAQVQEEMEAREAAMRAVGWFTDECPGGPGMGWDGKPPTAQQCAEARAAKAREERRDVAARVAGWFTDECPRGPGIIWDGKPPTAEQCAKARAAKEARVGRRAARAPADPKA